MEDAVDAVSYPGRRVGEEGAEAFSTAPTEFYAVYDGHGGVAAVEFVKRRLPGAVSGHRDFFCDPKAVHLHDVLRDAFALTDEELLAHFAQQTPPPLPQRRCSREEDPRDMSAEHRECWPVATIDKEKEGLSGHEELLPAPPLLRDLSIAQTPPN